MGRGRRGKRVVEHRDDGPLKSALLRDLGRAPDEPAIFSLPSPLLPWTGLALGVPLAFVLRASISGPVGVVFSAAVTLAYLVVMLYPRKLVVGEDGLLLVWIFSRFISYRDIAYIETYDGFYFQNPCINVALRSGSAVGFATSVFKQRFEERDALLHLLRAATLEASAQRVVRAPEPLLRGERDCLSWVRALRGIGAGANVDTRTPPVPTEDLLRVAECPSAPIVERAAAYVALAASPSDDVMRRLRVAADLTAAPNSREVLRAVLQDSEDEISLAAVLEFAEVKARR